jgi:predicted membrane protein
VVLATYLSNLIIDVTKIYEEGPYAAYRRIAGLVLLWANPGVFGFWVGFRLRNLRLRSRTIPLGAIVGLTATIITLSHDLVLTGLMTEILNHPEFLLNRWRFVITALSFRPIIRIWLPSWLLFVSAAMVGNAWQRSHIQRSSGTPPDWTTRQQAILGWSGTIISALISLIGTIITVWSGA